MNKYSPLRYPGGKTIMSEFFNNYIKANKMKCVTYVEPYAGGVGAGLKLLIEGKISKLIINDANIAIYSFWYSLINYSNQFLNLFYSTNISLVEWYRQKEIFTLLNKKDQLDEGQIIELGFATFFLNRCNRSGILSAGPIGGKFEESQNNADYKIDARFNKKHLKRQFDEILKYKRNIRVYNFDALDLLKKIIKTKSSILQQKMLVYLDPPYYIQGSNLYLNYYENKDHERLSHYLSKKSHFKWVLSYDDVPEIRKLYGNFEIYKFELFYSVEVKRIGKEVLIHSKNSVLPETLSIKKTKNKNILLKPAE